MRWCLNLLIHNEERRRGGINNGRRKERTGKITEKRFGKTLVVIPVKHATTMNDFRHLELQMQWYQSCVVYIRQKKNRQKH